MFACKVTGKQAIENPTYGPHEHITLALLKCAQTATAHLRCAWIDLALRLAVRAINRWGSAGRGAAVEALRQCDGLWNCQANSLDEALEWIIKDPPSMSVTACKRARHREQLWK